MASFKVGDRVEIVGDIARYYKSKIGLITEAEQRSVSVIKEFAVKLADGARGTFFDFQLAIPPARIARNEFDSSSSPNPGMRGVTSDRQLRFLTSDFDIHLSVTRANDHHLVMGQIDSREKRSQLVLVSLILAGEAHATTTTNLEGEFRLHDVPSGDITIEMFMPAERILSSFRI